MYKSPQTKSIKILSFNAEDNNTRANHKYDSSKRYGTKQTRSMYFTLLNDIISKKGVDIIVLQEVESNMVPHLGKFRDRDWYMFSHPRMFHPTQHIVYLYNAKNITSFNHRKNVSEPIMLFASKKCPKTPILLKSMHLEFWNRNGPTQIQSLKGDLKKFNQYPTLIIGDFNLVLKPPPQNTHYDSLQKVIKALDNESGSWYVDPTYTAPTHKNKVIDHAMINNYKNRNVKIVNKEVLSQYTTSDHFPIVYTLEICKASGGNKRIQKRKSRKRTRKRTRKRKSRKRTRKRKSRKRTRKRKSRTSRKRTRKRKSRKSRKRKSRKRTRKRKKNY